MFASIPAILQVSVSVAQAAMALIRLGKDAAQELATLKKLHSGGKITETELADIRARNDARNAEIEGQTEAGT